MSENSNSINENLPRLASLPPEQFLRAIRFDLDSALTEAKGYCHLLLNISDADLTTERRKEFASHILLPLERIDEILDVVVKALALRENNKDPYSES
jgi:hypothetical protein